jgi:hypothetical protein
VWRPYLPENPWGEISKIEVNKQSSALPHYDFAQRCMDCLGRPVRSQYLGSVGNQLLV